MRRIVIVMVALLLALSMISCGRVSQRQVEKMIDDAVEEALEEQAEEADKDKEAQKDEDEKDEADDKDDGNGDINSFGINYIGEEIPKDFPVEKVPLYESSDATVIGAARTEADSVVSYTFGIGTNDSTDDVIEDVEKALEEVYKKDEVQKISTGDSASFILVSDRDWSFTIIVGNGDEEGFETLIIYSVISN